MIVPQELSCAKSDDNSAVGGSSDVQKSSECGESGVSSRRYGEEEEVESIEYELILHREICLMNN
ncbi:hypothetical protein ACHAXA_001146 [Cyclostephanos tholiformis]|uniref:Uncharacterized protein n=1 Tax=Cyclostephanos tholiformis TaxID=382380 RepID=A0ABD3R5F5_9STRA